MSSLVCPFSGLSWLRPPAPICRLWRHGCGIACRWTRYGRIAGQCSSSICREGLLSARPVLIAKERHFHTGHRRRGRAVPYLTLALSLAMISDFPFLAKLVAMGIGVYFCQKATENIKILAAASVASLAVFAVFGGLDPIISAAKAYLFKDSFTVKTTLKYYDVVQTVREAGRMDINLYASRISGSMPVFILSLIGFALFVKKERLFALTLPMFGLGLFAYFGGLRFTVYAVPFASLGLFFFVFYYSNHLLNSFYCIQI